MKISASFRNLSILFFAVAFFITMSVVLFVFDFWLLFAILFGLFVIFTVLINIIAQRFVFKNFETEFEKLQKQNQLVLDGIYEPLEHLYARVEEQNKIIMDGIDYANKIQRNLLPPSSVLKSSFADHSVIWEPRDLVGGDIYWVKQFDEGTVLCVCDCTGHGAPGALLTTLVVSALESFVDPTNYKDTAQIVWKIEERLVRVFSVKTPGCENDTGIRDGCDLAVLFVDKSGNVTLSAGNTNVFVCNGGEVQRIKGQKIFIGEGNLSSKDDVKTLHIPANPDNKFYIATDGLFDQPGGEASMPFGYKRFEKIILENHNENQSVISEKIWTAFEEYRNLEPRVDDFELITFKP